MIRTLASDQAELIRRSAATATSFSPDFASPIAVANLQASARYYAEQYAQQVERNGELLARMVQQ